MSKNFFDYTDGDFCMSNSDNISMDMDEHLMSRMSDNMAMDLYTGELHMISSWNTDDEDE